MATQHETTSPGLTSLEVRPDPLAPLVSLLTMSHGQFTLAFVYYDHPGVRPWLMQKLQLALSDWQLAPVSLQDPALDLRNLSGQFFDNLQNLAQRHTDGQPYDAVLLLDWEQRLVPELPLTQQPSTSLVGVFNMGRHLLERAFACPFVVLVPQETMDTLFKLAPDFVSWQSGAFLVPCDVAAIEADVRAALEATRVARREALASVAERLEAYVRSLQSIGEERFSAALVMETLASLGDLCLTLGNVTAAEAHFTRLEHLAEEHGARQWQKRARRGRRQAARRLPPQVLMPETLATAPWEIFRGAAALTEEDSIYGREEDLRQILTMLIGPTFRWGTLWGETGCGKTSLARAGLVPSLRNQGYLAVYLNQYGADPTATLIRAVAIAAGLSETPATLSTALRASIQITNKSIIFVCDQFERVFVDPATRDRQAREPFLRSVAECINDLTLSVRWLLLVRADHLYYLTECDALTPLYPPLAQDNRYELRWLRAADAARVLQRLREAAQATWQDALIDVVVADLARDGRVRPVEIQLVAAGLYLRHINTPAMYAEVGGRDGILKDYLSAIFDTLSQPQLARRVVRSLVILTNPPLRALRSAGDIAAEIHARERDVIAVLEALVTPRVVQTRPETSPPAYELVHDILVEPALRAITPQEIGVSALRSALAHQRRFLTWREYRAARRSDLAELPERQQPAARQLLRHTAAMFYSLAFATACSFLFVLVTVVQLTSAHVYIGEPLAPLVVRRGWWRLDFLPGFLGPQPLFDTGLTADDVPSDKRSAIAALALHPTDAIDSTNVSQLIKHLHRPSAALLLLYVGDWQEGIRVLSSAMGDPENDFQSSDGGSAVRITDSHSSARAIYSRVTYRIVYLDISGRLIIDERALFGERALASIVQVIPKMAVTSILPLLRDDKPSVRRVALLCLQQLGASHGEIPMHAIMPLLGDKIWPVRQAAIEALQQVGATQAEVVVPALLPLLHDDSSYVREAASRALQQVGATQADVVVPALLPLLDDKIWQVRRAATEALQQVGATQADVVVPALLPLLRDDMSEVRQAAIAALQQVGASQAEVVVPALLPLLDDKIWPVWQAASRALQQVGATQAEVVVPALLPLLRDDHSEVRQAAIQTLRRMGTAQADKLVARFLPLLRWEVQNVIETALKQHGVSQSEMLTQTLHRFLHEDQGHIRQEAAMVLGYLGKSNSDQIIPDLLPLLDDDVWQVRRAATEALQQVGAAQAEVVVPALLPLLRDDMSEVRQAAIAALQQVEATQAEVVVPALLPLLGDKIWSVRQAAIRALQQVGATQAEVVVPALLPLLRSDSSYVREAAIAALQQVRGPQAEVVVPTLLSVLHDDSSDVREAAMAALQQVDAPQAEVIVPALLPLLRDDNSYVRQVASQTLQRVGMAQAEVVMPALLPLLRDDNSYVRQAAIQTLRWVGAAQTNRALPELLSLLSDSDAEVRRTAAETLAAIWLFLAQKQSAQPVYKSLLQQLEASKSRLDARYRDAIVLALARWYNAGFAEAKPAPPPPLPPPLEVQETDNMTYQDPRTPIGQPLPLEAEGTDNTIYQDPRAQGEHQDLQKTLENLCYHGTRLWLRSAACQVWSEAYRLRYIR